MRVAKRMRHEMNNSSCPLVGFTPIRNAINEEVDSAEPSVSLELSQRLKNLLRLDGQTCTPREDMLPDEEEQFITWHAHVAEKIMRVAQRFRLTFETQTLAVLYFVRALHERHYVFDQGSSTQTANSARAVEVSIAASVMLAAKFKEVVVPAYPSLSNLCDNVPIEDIKRTELDMLQHLEWRLHVVSAVSIVEEILSGLPYGLAERLRGPEPSQNSTFGIMKLILKDAFTWLYVTSYSAGFIAHAVLHVAAKRMDCWEILRPCLQDLNLLKNSDKLEYSAVMQSLRAMNVFRELEGSPGSGGIQTASPSSSAPATPSGGYKSLGEAAGLPFLSNVEDPQEIRRRVYRHIQDSMEEEELPETPLVDNDVATVTP